LTSLDTHPIRERYNEATEGPWEWEWCLKTESGKLGYLLSGKREKVEPGVTSIPCILDGCEEVGGNDHAVWGKEADREFIAHARTDIPVLCDEVDRLKAALNSLLNKVN